MLKKIKTKSFVPGDWRKNPKPEPLPPKCPECGSTKLEKYIGGGFECEECGYYEE